MKVEVTRRVGLVLDCSARCDVSVYVFEYHEARRKGVVQEFLAGWSGTLVFVQEEVEVLVTKVFRV